MIIDLKDIEYKDEGYNKKTVFDNQNSSLTLIAFRAGNSRALHTDPADEVAQIIEGTAEVIISTQSHILNPGQMIVMPKGQAHTLKAITDVKMLLLRPKHTH